MMILALSFTLLLVSASAACNEATWTCPYTEEAPELDADLSEWGGIEAYTTSLTKITLQTYEEGNAKYKCMYDDTHIYFALEIPGVYRFNETENSQCAAIATMMKIGAQATFVNMGGCPEALNGCEDTGVPDVCLPYRVDIGAHWELSSTQQGVTYGINTGNGTGNDPIANKDDEYAVSSKCRLDDNDGSAGNEWAGAWRHTNPVEGGMGSYIFELSRTLSTPSTLTDAQMVPGETYSFGVAFWDPFETESGWTDSGHYVTGCGTSWIDLELAADEPAPATAPKAAATSSSHASAASFLVIVATMAVGTIC